MIFLCKFMQVYAFSCILFDCLQRFIHVIQQIYLFYRFIAYTLALVRPCAKIFNLLTTNFNICCQFARFELRFDKLWCSIRSARSFDYATRNCYAHA